MAVPDRFSLDGRTAIVTGASSGLGAAVVRTLADAGANVVATARREDRLAALADGIPACVPLACDLTDAAARALIVTTAADRFGGVHILVNAAGAISGVVPAETEALAAVDETLQLNLVAPFHLAQLVQPHMVRAGGGSILNVASISGIVGVPGLPQASYAASKRALSGLTTELAVQWGAHGIRVNALAAGMFESEMTADLYADPKSLAWLARNTALPWRCTPEELVGPVLLLVSEAGRYITGQTIVVDGGWTAR